MTTSFRLPPALRPDLAQPFGHIYDSATAVRVVGGRTLITVGDVVTQTFLDAGRLPKVMVIDGHTQRGAVGIAAAMPRRRDEPGGVVENALANLPEGVRHDRVKNPAAMVTHQLLAALDRAMRAKGSTLIHVDGEEDLAALPAMIIAPEGAVVAYGQPNQGVVVVILNSEARQRAKDIMSKLEAV